MSQVAPLLQAIAALAWPLVVAVVLWRLAPLLTEIAATAKTRKFSIEVGGQKLSMEEANHQQQDLIKDVQIRILAIERRLGPPGVQEGMPVTPAAQSKSRSGPRRILWVDDNPKNNGFMIQRLIDDGFRVDLALSTEDGSRRIAEGSYDLILSDMGRHEFGRFNPTAGLDLLREVRAKGHQSPVIFCTSDEGVRNYGDEARKRGAAGITASTTELWGLILTLSQGQAA